MKDTTKLLLLMGLLLLAIFPFAGLAPLIFLILIGLLGMILQLVGGITLSRLDSSKESSPD